MAIATEEPVGNVETALQHAARLLATNPALAEEQAREILKAAPDEPRAHLMLGSARAGQGRHADAARALKRAAELDPNSNIAWRELGDQLTLLGDEAGADAAYAQSIRTSVNDPKLMQAARALCEGKLAIAERELRAHLYQQPTDVAAIRMLAEVAARLGRFEDSEKLLSRCIELAPGFVAARHNYAIVLHRQSKSAEALTQLDLLLKSDPNNASLLFLRAAALARIGEYEQSIALYRRVLSAHPENARGWLSLGHALKTAGKSAESEAAYRRSIEIEPSFGEAYWSLANMKTYRFDNASVRAMQAQLKRKELVGEDRLHLHFALGKALEDRADFAASFQHYSEGANIRRQALHYDADETTAFVEQSKRTFCRAFFSERTGWGASAPDPIFIVGLPRSGSTLLEQILSSHSAVEGTMELAEIGMIAKAIGDGRTRGGVYPEAVTGLSEAEARALGEDYILRTRVQRKTKKPFFIDKMPNNFQHVGLIHLILPNAKIIDARRHPVAACFSTYKQHFARGQAFSYDLKDLGRYYRDYLALMAHWDAMLPGCVHRVFYEELVAEPEPTIRNLLTALGLPFEPACLAFHENPRPVRTASSEQVRRPLYTTAVDHWRNYEPWLAPLKEALGSDYTEYKS